MNHFYKSFEEWKNEQIAECGATVEDALQVESPLTAARIGFEAGRIGLISPDSNVEKNRELLLQRSIVGLAKYGAMTDNNPLPLRDWLQHALEETLDLANYLQAAISKLDEEGK